MALMTISITNDDGTVFVVQREFAMPADAEPNTAELAQRLVWLAADSAEERLQDMGGQEDGTDGVGWHEVC